MRIWLINELLLLLVVANGAPVALGLLLGPRCNQALDAGHLFEPSVTRIGFRRDVFMRDYMYEFIEMWAPHLGADLVNEAIKCRSANDLEGLFSAVEIPAL